MLRHRLTTFLLLLAGETASLILLHRRPLQPLDQLLSTPPEDAVIAVVHYVALGVAWWLAMSTLLYFLATASRVPALIRSVRWITTPGVRTVVDRVVVTTIVASSTLSVPSVAFAAPAGPSAGGPPPYPAPAQPYRPHPADPASTPSPHYLRRPAADEPASPAAFPYQPHPAGDPAEPAPTPRETKSSPPLAADPDSSHDGTYVIQPGDHLWGVAARLVAYKKGSGVSNVTTRDIGRYWVRLIELNRARLRSGDPNLVYKGETILLPSSEDS